MSSRLDRTANVVSIAAGSVICVLVIAQALQQRRGETEKLPDVYPTGTVLESSDGVTFDNSPITVLVGLSTTCRFCDESVPAFQQLNAYVAALGERKVQIIALGFQPSEVLSDWLRKNGLTSFRAVTMDGGSSLARVARVTPSVVLVDGRGAVVLAWPGMMTRQRATETISQLGSRLEAQSTVPGEPSNRQDGGKS